MSYREISDFIRIMCVLGYPRVISRENFRSTNFPLVAEILHWFCQRLDANSGIELVIENENDRVNFISSAVYFLINKLHFKINAKRIYLADNMAVRELLIVATFFHNALLVAQSNSIAELQFQSYEYNGNIEDVREMRQLSSEITIKGASIHDLLSQEMRSKNQRVLVLQRNYELNKIEIALQNRIKTMKTQITSKQEEIDSIASTEIALDQRIEKKNQELQRLLKRLETMKNIRPPFMEEFEKLEGELRHCYEEYVSKFRCLSFLDSQWQELEKSEQQELEERQAAARKMAERLRQEETLQALEAAVGGTWEGGQEFDLSSEGSLESVENAKNSNKSGTRPRIGSRRIAIENDTNLLDLETEDSDLEAEDPRLEEGSDSDVTIDEWQNEARTWEVGSLSNKSMAKNDQIIKPISAHISEDDF